MARRKKKAGEIRIDPSLHEPVDPEQFSFAIQVGSAAGAYRTPMESPTTQSVLIDMGQGKIKRISFTDIPENRFFMAVRDHFVGDPMMFQRVALRWFALQRLHDSPEMKKWTKKDPDDPSVTLISDSVFAAAATCPFTGKLEFDEEVFFETVEQFSKEED